MNPPISYGELIQKTGIDFQLPINSNENSNESKSNQQAEVAKSDGKQLIGGWYPVFFDQYSPQKVKAIISDIQSGRVASIQIQYDRNGELAQKLAQEIQAQGLIQATLIQSSPPDSSAVSYERQRVTAIVRTQ
jgi:endonuclease G